jgi:uncharacterized OB-fold protein
MTQTSGGPSTVDAVAEAEEGLRGLRFPLPTEPVRFFQPEAGIGTAAFWEGARNGELRLTRCAVCDYITHPAGPRCARCGSADCAPAPVSGRGTLFAWTVSVQAFMPGLQPYCVALVQLEEQEDLRLTSQLVDAGVEDLRVGLPVEVVFVDAVGDLRLPFFRPVSA